MRSNRLPLILGVSGASGLIYAVRALKFLLDADYAIELVASKSTYMVWQIFSNAFRTSSTRAILAAASRVETKGKLLCHPWGDVGADIASGSFHPRDGCDSVQYEYCGKASSWAEFRLTGAFS